MVNFKKLKICHTNLYKFKYIYKIHSISVFISLKFIFSRIGCGILSKNEEMSHEAVIAITMESDRNICNM